MSVYLPQVPNLFCKPPKEGLQKARAVVKAIALFYSRFSWLASHLPVSQAILPYICHPILKTYV